MVDTEVSESGENNQAEQPANTARRAYSAPRVLGAESLEAAAATCSPPAPPFGKSVPFPCSSLGS